MALGAAVLLALTAFFATHAIKVPVQYSLDSLFLAKDDPDGDEHKLEDYRQFVERFGSDDNVLTVMYEADDVFSPEAMRAVEQVGRQLEQIPGVEQQLNLVEVIHLLDQLKRGALFQGFTRKVTDLPGLIARAPKLRADMLDEDSCFVGTFVSPDAKATLIYLQISQTARTDSKLRARTLAGIRQAFDEVTRAHGGQFALAGIPVIEAQYEVQIIRDQATFLPTGTLLFLVLLALYFRRVLGVLLPILSICAAVTWTLGIVELTGKALNIVNGALPVLLLVIGITDAIHIMAHFYRRLEAGDSTGVAMRDTFREMRVACFITSFTTAVGFLSLLLINVTILQDFGKYAALGLMLCYFLTMAGIWIGLVLANRPEPETADPNAEAPAVVSGQMEAGPVGLLPWLGLAVGVLIFAGFGYLIHSRLQVQSRWFQDFDKTARIYQDAHRIEQRITGVFALEVVLEGEPGYWLEPERLEALARASRDIEKHDAVTTVLSLADLLAEANFWLFGKREVPRSREQIERMLETVRQRGGEKMLRRLYSDSAIHATIRMKDISSGLFKPLTSKIKQDLARQSITPAAGRRIIYTGKSVLAGRAMDEVVQNMVSSLGFALIFISLTMMLLFRSIKIGLISMIPNVFPIVVTLGTMGLIGIDLNFSTMFVFSIALGIAVDDTIHVLARYQREQRKGQAGVLRRTYASVGKVIVVTTIFLMLGVSVLYLSEFRFLHNFALLMQTTLCAAIVGDLILLPALLALMDLPCPVGKKRPAERG